MAIAFVPLNEDPKGSRINWLSMSQADELLCKHLNVEPYPTRYHKGWFDAFYAYDWYNTKNQSEDNYSVVFETAENAKSHFFNTFCKNDIQNGSFDEESLNYYKEVIIPMINLLYDKGYKIVSLNIG
jgi:hypothetical protein